MTFVEGFPDLLDTDFTSHMEEQLDEVEGGYEALGFGGAGNSIRRSLKEMELAQSIPGPKDIVEPPTNLPCEKCIDGDQVGKERQVSRLSCVQRRSSLQEHAKL